MRKRTEQKRGLLLDGLPVDKTTTQQNVVPMRALFSCRALDSRMHYHLPPVSCETVNLPKDRCSTVEDYIPRNSYMKDYAPRNICFLTDKLTS